MFVSHNQLHVSGFSGEVNLLGSAPGTVLHMFPQNMSHNETFQGLVKQAGMACKCVFISGLLLLTLLSGLLQVAHS